MRLKRPEVCGGWRVSRWEVEVETAGFSVLRLPFYFSGKLSGTGLCRTEARVELLRFKEGKREERWVAF